MRLKPIEPFKVGDSVVTYVEYRSDISRPAESTNRYKICLNHKRETGGEVAVVLLRELEWLRAHRAEPGVQIELILPEMGVSGLAMVLSIGEKKRGQVHLFVLVNYFGSSAWT